MIVHRALVVSVALAIAYPAAISTASAAGRITSSTPQHQQKSQQSQQAPRCFGNPKEKKEFHSLGSFGSYYDVFALQPNCTYKLVKTCTSQPKPKGAWTSTYKCTVVTSNAR